ncbi:hypothetical protein DFH28DRAFT_287266 [Melampsora americana]|nr:hypothetical protein DFH28DRAFT_287266 [Melampsora americana]
MSDSVSLATTSFSTVRGHQSGTMLASPPMFSDLSRQELERLRTALQTESTSFEHLPRLLPDLTLSDKNPNQLAFRCVKIVKKSPRRSLIPQTDWLKLIADGNEDLPSESIAQDDSLQKTTKLNSHDQSQTAEQQITSIESDEKDAPRDRRHTIHNVTKIDCLDEKNLDS